MKKLVSHASHQLSDQNPIPAVSFDGEEMFFVNDSGEFEGRIVTKGQFKPIRPSDNMKGLKCSDFSIENALAIGVKPTPVSIIGDNFSMIEDIQRAVDSFENLDSEPIKTE